MKHYGDICKLKGEELPEVDIITGGSPCQDLSIAGKRAGLDGERSGLFMEQIRVIKEMRAEYARKHGIKADDVRRIKPRFMVWENVPGAFSSNNGEDFRAVLEETARIVDPNASIPGLEDGESWRNSGFILGDEWAVAWRVHDAQFWGVPQRRRRISLVADFGGQTAPEILFERESVPGDIKQGGEEGQGIAADLAGGNNSASKEKLIVDNHRQDARFKICQDDICPTIYAKQGTGGNNGPMVLETISFQERGGKPGGEKGILTQEEKTGALSTLNNQAVVYRKTAHPMNKDDGQGWEPADVSDTLNIFDNSESRTPTVVIEGNGSRPSHNGPGFEESDVSYTLNTIERHGVCYTETVGALQAVDYKGPNNQYVNRDKLQITGDSIVRRLTPLECERLQGFPDGWTNIGTWTDSKGKKHKESDAPRYKALGNSIALPFWEFLAGRMVEQLKADGVESPTMASLFDGIGGFPLVFSRCGCSPIWASEIEEFPIAVTKIRFPEVGENGENI